MSLTKRQKEILDFLEESLATNGYAPSYEEIADHFGLASLATVHEHLENLQEKGYIRKGYNRSRAIELIPRPLQVSAVELPLLGLVAAGHPIRSEEHTSELQSRGQLVCRLLLENKTYACLQPGCGCEIL